MSSSDPSKALLMQHFLKDRTIMLSGMALADTHRATSEGAERKGQLKERCGLEPRTNLFFCLRNRQKLVRIRFENIRYFCTRQRKENFTFGVQTHSHSLSSPLLYCHIAHNQEFCTAMNFEAPSLVFQNRYISILRALGKVQWFAES